MKLSGGLVMLIIWVASVAGSRQCPENCKKKHPFPDCNTDTGTCSRGCVPGYYGNTCNLKCDANCEKGTCQKRNGLCICKRGYTFNSGSCDSHKGVICESNDHCLNNTCLYADRPDCLEGCKPGWFGKFCQQPCSPKCMCHRESGNCTGCIPGWYGAECGTRCSQACVDKMCDTDGSCSGGCANGFYGEKCESICQEQCYNDQCDNNGTCITCKLGFYGTFCNKACQRCTEKVCEKITGECLRGCDRGFYGEGCINSCGKCAKEECNQTTGACIKGCQSGHYGFFCRQNCVGGECDRDTGECLDEWSSVPSWVGGGVAVVILIIVAVGVYVSRRLKRIQGVVYNIEKRRLRPPSTEHDVQPVAAQGYFELEERITVTSQRVCPSVPIRQTSYIEPRHSGNIVNLQTLPQLQAAGVSDQQEYWPQGAAAPPSDRLQQKVQQRSDEWSDSYVLPHYCEVDEEGMATLPQPAQGAEASTSVVTKTVFSVAVDEHATRGDIRIPPIAECFGPTGTDDSSPDLQPLVQNYDHLKRVCIPRIGGAGASRYSQVDDEVRNSLERLCQMNTARSESSIEPRHSDCSVSPQHQKFSSEASDQQEDEPQAAVVPPSDRLLHDAAITNIPKPAQAAEEPAHGANSFSFSVKADVIANGGEISSPLIAECFGPTETEDSSPDEVAQSCVENYDHLFRDQYMEH